MALSTHRSKPPCGAHVLLLGLAYKKDVSEMRESPGLKLIEFLERRGATVSFHDPHISDVVHSNEHPSLAGRRSVDLTSEVLSSCDAVLLSADHDCVDYSSVADHATLVVDTHNRMAKLASCKALVI